LEALGSDLRLIAPGEATLATRGLTRGARP
jgi:hypothetical protein